MNRWFNKNGGKVIHAKENPIDRKEDFILWQQWMIKYNGLFTCLYSAIAFINEKWFYLSNQRRKFKELKL